LGNKKIRYTVVYLFHIKNLPLQGTSQESWGSLSEAKKNGKKNKSSALVRIVKRRGGF
jgi:hypothetical protein